jgi:hypothetical protein
MIIGEIEKNTREKFIISIDEFYGHTLINCRVYFRTDSGDWRPTKKGITFRRNNIDEELELLKEAGKKLKG